MYIKSWGSRGSIPVSGSNYLKYGGDTTCIEIRSSNDDVIIIDSGTGIRRLGNQLIREEKFNYHLVYTHAHWDHLMGFPAFKPLFLQNTCIKVYRCPFPDDYIEKMLSKIIMPPNFPVKYSDLKAKIYYTSGCPEKFKIGSLEIEPISLNHPDGGCGYKFTENGKTFVFLTDNELGYDHPGGLSTEDYINFCSGADLLIHDAEYSEKEYVSKKSWGHSTYTDALQLALKSKVGALGLFHLNSERTDEEMDTILSDCKRIIKSNNSALKCIAVGCNTSFKL
jgi:phosphoribosyl 1,2-cyclic phosphodiesterase